MVSDRMNHFGLQTLVRNTLASMLIGICLAKKIDKSVGIGVGGKEGCCVVESMEDAGARVRNCLYETGLIGKRIGPRSQLSGIAAEYERGGMDLWHTLPGLVTLDGCWAGRLPAGGAVDVTAGTIGIGLNAHTEPAARW